MQNPQDRITWALLRENADKMGWPHIIRTEITPHLNHLLFGDISAYPLTLHYFYEHIATPEERHNMLKAGYTPHC